MTVMIAGIYISKLYRAQFYIAERSYKGSQKLLWSTMPEALDVDYMRVDANCVPRLIRRQAYRVLAHT
jgi:hypothetical protein